MYKMTFTLKVIQQHSKILIHSIKKPYMNRE